MEEGNDSTIHILFDFWFTNGPKFKILIFELNLALIGISRKRMPKWSCKYFNHIDLNINCLQYNIKNYHGSKIIFIYCLNDSFRGKLYERFYKRIMLRLSLLLMHNYNLHKKKLIQRLPHCIPQQSIMISMKLTYTCKENNTIVAS